MGFTYSCFKLNHPTLPPPELTLKNALPSETPTSKNTTSSFITNNNILKAHNSGNLFTIRLINTNFKTKTNGKSNHFNNFCDSNRSHFKRCITHFEEIKDYKENIKHRLNSFSIRTIIIPVKKEEEFQVKNKDSINSPTIDDQTDYEVIPESTQCDKNNTNIETIENTIVDSSKTIMEQRDVLGGKKVHLKHMRSKKTYKIISEALSEMQIQYIRNILQEEEMIIKEMDEHTM